MPKDTFFNLSPEKQEKVMRAAISEFVNRGFEKGNIGDIAKSAGVSKGSMYQYFENKKELFLYSVNWALELIMQKYDKDALFNMKHANLFDYFYENIMAITVQLREEREAVIFLENVFLGKYSGVSDECLDQLMKVSEDYVLQLIKEGKKKGYIRKDIDDHILSLFITGASIKMKGYLIEKSRSAGEDIIDQSAIEANEREIKSIIDLLINGMGEK